MNSTGNEQGTQGQPARKRRGCLGCLGRAAIGVAVCLAIVLIAGAIYQSATSAADLAKYPPPGRMVSVGDHRLHLYCTGAGAPTVILEAGASSPALTWHKVQQEIATFTRVCSYDRAGFGWSDRVSGGRSPEQVATELHALLVAASVPGPYVLVGHSAGGLYVRSFAAQYPSETAGLVLVDSSSEGESLRYPPEYQQMAGAQSMQMQFCQVVAPFGLVRLMRILDALAPESSGPADVRAAAAATLYQTPYCQAASEEMQALAAVTGRPGTPAALGDLPLIVLTAGMTAEEEYAQLPESVRSMVSLDLLAKVYAAHQEAQRGLAGLSTRGKQVIATESGHYIQWDQPELVIDAVRDVMDEVRGE